MAAHSLLIKAGKLTLSSSSSSHPLLAVKHTSLLRPLIPASTSANIPCFSLAAETVAQPSLCPDHDPRRIEFPDRSDFELGLDFEHWQVCLGGFHSGFTRGEIVDTCVGKAVTRDDIIDTYVKTLAMVVGSLAGEPFINGQALPFDTKYYLPFIHRSPFIHRIPSRGGRP